jgi:hypothetical protein
MAYFIEEETETLSTPAPKPNFKRNNPAAPANRRPNRYAGKCIKCGARVEAEAGYLAGSPGAWAAEHKDCNEVTAPAATAAATATFAVAEGRYTVQFENGSYKTLRVRRQDEDADFMPGRLVVSFLSGSDNDRDYTSFGHVDDDGTTRIWKRYRQNTELVEALKVLIGSPTAAREAYAEQSGCCSRCGRTLTVPTSLHAGLGPECAKKVDL